MTRKRRKTVWVSCKHPKWARTAILRTLTTAVAACLGCGKTWP